MKKNILRLISLVLVLASLASVFSVSLLAAGGDAALAEQTEETVQDPNAGIRFDENESLFINRTFDDGWDPFNGSTNDATMVADNSVIVDKEVMSNLKYNYFVRFEQGKSASKGLIVYSLGARVAKEKVTVLSLSIKADDACDLGEILRVTPSGSLAESPSESTVPVLSISGDTLYGYGKALASLGDGEWVNLDIIFDWNDNNYFTSYIYVNGSTEQVAYKQESWNKGVKNAGLKSVSIGLYTPSAARVGMGFCIDNVQLYQDVYAKYDVSGYGYGMNINNMLEKTVPIYIDESELTPEAALRNSLAMKVGISSALFKDKKIDISNYIAPVKVDGKVMVPLELIVKYLGYPSYIHPDGASYSITTTSGDTTYITLGRDNAKVNGKIVDLVAKPASIKNAEGKDVAVIAIDDIETLFPGFDLIYDDMGLIVMHPTVVISGEHQTILSREKNLGDMLGIMKKFVFDVVDHDEDDKVLEEESAYMATGEHVYNAVANKTNGFQHPYLLVSGQKEFDDLRATVKEGTNRSLSLYAQGFIAKMDAYYGDVVDTRDAETGAVTFKKNKAPVNVYMDNVWPDVDNPDAVPDSNDGYSSTNFALYELEEFTADLVDLAFAYQLTEDGKYLDLAYAMAATIADWTHWAPGFFVNCATGAANFAIAYDWLYNAWVERFGIDAVDVLADAIYSKALYHGYNSISGEICEFIRDSGTGDRFINRTDSWNAIGTAGMVIGAMAIMDRVMQDGAVTAEGELIHYVVGGSIINFAKNGLDRYAPDGSYIDSVTYWAKGTNAIMQLVAALDTAAGTDLGIINSWGLYDTFYYACHMESSDGDAWNYHEDGLGSIINADYLFVDTSIFNLAATLLGDENLHAIRYNQINKGKEVSFFDILYYPNPNEEFNKAPELELDYYMDGIDAFVSRSDWEEGALYVGIMGGDNVYSSYADGDGDEVHGQLDSGNFIYYNLGVQWIIDMGSDNHYIDQYFGADRFKYYRNNAEGHNVVLITNDPTNNPGGQYTNGSGDMYSHYTAADGSGSFAIINNTAAYKSTDESGVAAAYRGMMLTDNRETVVIQDEVAVNGMADLAWIVHTAQRIEVEEDGRTAYLINIDDTGKRTMMRASIVSTYDEFKFTVLAKNTEILKGTNRSGSGQFDRSGVQRLAIIAKGTISLNVAVVFEYITNRYTAEPTAYEWTGLHAWKSLFEEEQVDDGKISRDTPDRNTIIDKSDLANTYYNDETAFTTEFYNFYVALADVAYALRTYPEDSFGSLANASDPSSMQLYNQLMLAMAIYKDLVNTYDEYAELINDSVEQNYQFARILAGE